ncbi:hypothetical protein [Roseitranquillus sediminis]|uniref:hypothetical protein n=1 Tax=Roseitranquillus sediminis TaxID=2809051 RepID=UPI001D0C67C7|nr:hypothetical protein [Roseitranquillus sediminis]MBM9593932.1 hypothetical protein [Roseitranquillus sediminis]
MRQRYLLLIATILAFHLHLPASAQQGKTSPPNMRSGDKTQILTDQEKGTVTIIIDGQSAVMIDKTGLYVVNEIMYGRSLTDTGPDWVKARIEKGADDASKDLVEGGVNEE